MTVGKLKQPKMFKTNDLRTQIDERIAFINFFYTAIVLNIINLVFVFAMQRNLPPEVPLFYGYIESEQQLTTPAGLLIPGVFAMILLFANITISMIIKNDYLKKVLSVSTFTISFLLLITVINIIFLIGTF